MFYVFLNARLSLGETQMEDSTFDIECGCCALNHSFALEEYHYGVARVRARDISFSELWRRFNRQRVVRSLKSLATLQGRTRKEKQNKKKCKSFPKTSSPHGFKLFVDC